MATDANVPAQDRVPALRVSHVGHRYRKRVMFGEGDAHLESLVDISFEIPTGETLSVIGKSGSGKSTLAKCILGIEKPDSGEISLEGLDCVHACANERRAIQRKMQAVFQDSSMALNPRIAVAELIEEPLQIHRIGSRRSRRERALELLDTVGLPKLTGVRRPFELSGGQRQRVALARALALRPSVLILDEPLSSLDLSVKAQLSNLLMDLQNEFHFTYLQISHDLFGVARSSDQVVVMQEGRIVERAASRDLFTNPQHSETRYLLGAIS